MGWRRIKLPQHNKYWLAPILMGLALFSLAHLGAISVQAQTPVPSGVPTSLGPQVHVTVPDTQLTLTGCAAPNAFVTIYSGNQPVGTVVADSGGRFSKTITAHQGGLQNIKLYYDDVNNRTSSIVTRNISLTPHSNTAFDLLLPTTIEHEPEPVRVGNYLIFRGTTCPFALVNVIINNNFTLAAKADQRGNWYAIADTSNFYVGAHVYEAVSDIGSLVSERTHKYQFTTIGPNSGRRSAEPVDLTTPYITEPANDFLSSSPLITFRGTGPSVTPVEIFVDGKPAGSVFTNAIGEFSFLLTMTSPRHVVTVRACHDNRCSSFSNSVAVRYAGNLNDCSMRFTLDNYRFFGLKSDSGLDINIQNLVGRPAYDVLVDWGDTTVEHFSLLDDNDTRWHHVYKQPGKYNAVVITKDSSDCAYTQYFTVDVADPPGPNWFWIGLITSFTAAVGLSAYKFAWLAKLRASRATQKLAPHWYRPVSPALIQSETDLPDNVVK